MKIGEVCLLTNDVVKLANFYKYLLGVENGSDNSVHQFILTDETALAIFNDGTVKNNCNQNICLAFTVDNLDQEYERLQSAGVEFIEPPTVRPWGVKNMSFYDPDRNVLFMREFFRA